MQGYPYKIRSLETDIFGYAPPSLIARACMHGNSMQSDAEDMPMERLLNDFGAVWMLAKLKVWQEAPVLEGDELELCVSSRGIEGATFIRLVEVLRAGVLVARGKFVYVVVRLEDKRILRPPVIEASWKNPRPLSVSDPLQKIKIPEQMEEAGSFVVRCFDCDLNGHFSSPGYAALACETVGYWRSGPKLMKELQIEFNSELLPKEEVFISVAARDGRHIVRGVKRGGAVAFAAECFFEDMEPKVDSAD